MDEALQEIWRTKFEKAEENEFNIVIPATEKEVELLKLKIDMCLEKDDIEGFKNLCKELESMEFFLRLKSNAQKIKEELCRGNCYNKQPQQFKKATEL